MESNAGSARGRRPVLIRSFDFPPLHDNSANHLRLDYGRRQRRDRSRHSRCAGHANEPGHCREKDNVREEREGLSIRQSRAGPL